MQRHLAPHTSTGNPPCLTRSSPLQRSPAAARRRGCGAQGSRQTSAPGPPAGGWPARGGACMHARAGGGRHVFTRSLVAGRPIVLLLHAPTGTPAKHSSGAPRPLSERRIRRPPLPTPAPRLTSIVTEPSAASTAVTTACMLLVSCTTWPAANPAGAWPCGMTTTSSSLGSPAGPAGTGDPSHGRGTRIPQCRSGCRAEARRN